MSALVDTLKYVELGELAFAKSSRAEAVKEFVALNARIAKLEAALTTIDSMLTGSLPVTAEVKRIIKEAMK